MSLFWIKIYKIGVPVPDVSTGLHEDCYRPSDEGMKGFHLF